MPEPDDSAHRLLPLTPAVFQILLALADEPRHGLGILQEVDERSEGLPKMGPGTLYGTIQRMCSSGLITDSRHRPPAEHDDPRRRYYEITELGRRAARLESERLAGLLREATRKRVFGRAASGERGR